MNEKDIKKTEKKQYESPKIVRLGKLGTLIQGGSGERKDFPPNESAPARV